MHSVTDVDLSVALDTAPEFESGDFARVALHEQLLAHLYEGLVNVMTVPRTHLVEQEVALVRLLKLLNLLICYLFLRWIYVTFVCKDHYHWVFYVCFGVDFFDPLVNSVKALGLRKVHDYHETLSTSPLIEYG